MASPSSEASLASDPLDNEQSRHFHATRWSGPLGFGTAAIYYALMVSPTDMDSGRLRWWILAMLVVAVVQALGFLIPASARWVDPWSVPYVCTATNVLIGIGWGAVLWLDIDASRTVETRWITMAILFAVSSGMVAGISGLSLLDYALFVPSWLGAIAALLYIGEYTSVLACTVFAIICLVDQQASGGYWRELMTLRSESHDVAAANVWAATHDPVTSLLNRTGLMAVLEERSGVARESITAMFIDLDRFKEVNDTYGHAAGDHVLIEAARRIEHCVRSADVVCRFGGDEFCVLLESDSDEIGADRAAEAILETLERPFVGPWGDEEVSISASIGVASVTPEVAKQDPERLLLDADSAMYEAKRLGRHRVVHFGCELESEVAIQLGLKSDLRRVIADGLLEADGQPVFDLRTGRVAGVELLARWRQPDGTMVPPGVFIPMAEDLGLISEITKVMLHQAGRYLTEWRDDPILGGAKVLVNVSALDIAGGELVGEVASILSDFDLDPARLVLEITESLDVAGSPSDLAQFAALRKLGVGIAIDDFGTGYSSLASLLSFPVDIVKLDASLIANLGDDPRQSLIVRRITELAEVIGQRVIVEGVETQVQLVELGKLNLSYAQGYHLCRPAPAATLAEKLANQPCSIKVSRQRAEADAASAAEAEAASIG